MSRRSVTILAVAALNAWALRGLADDKAADTPARTGAITGVVVDSQARPIAGASVWGVARQERFGPTRSGDDGRFRLSALKADKPVTVWAEAPGLARERRDALHIIPGKDRDLGRLTLLPGTRMRGRVVDAQGQPIAGAEVKLALYRHTLGHSANSHETEWTFSADADGRFTTSPLPAGQANFRLAAPGKVRTFVSKPAEPGTAVVDLGDVTLADEIPVAGVVVDQDGKPARGVEVIPDYDRDSVAKTDENGRFALHGIGKGLKALYLESNDYFSPKPFDVDPGKIDLKLTVIKAYEIHGTAVDAETGKPVPIDTVRLCLVRRDPDDGHVSLQG